MDEKDLSEKASNTDSTHVHWHLQFSEYFHPEPRIDVRLRLSKEILWIDHTDHFCNFHYFRFDLPSVEERLLFLEGKSPRLSALDTGYGGRWVNRDDQLIYCCSLCKVTDHAVGFAIPKTHSKYQATKDRLFELLQESLPKTK